MNLLILYIGDCTESDNALCRETLERCRIGVELEDPAFIKDLRTTNPGRPDTKFDEYFAEMRALINDETKVVQAADCRHYGDGVATMSTFLSIR